jgi:hypothetical protein
MSDQSSKPTAPQAPTAAQLAQAQQQAAVTAALRGAAPRLYANAIHTAQTSSDVSLILMSNFAAAGVVSMSYTTAKSLKNELDRVISQLEEATGQKVLSIDEINEKLQDVMESNNVTRLG